MEVHCIGLLLCKTWKMQKQAVTKEIEAWDQKKNKKEQNNDNRNDKKNRKQVHTSVK